MNECDNCGGVGQCEVGCGGPSNGRQTGSVVSPDAGNDTEALRAALAAIVYRVNNGHYGDYGTHEETADAILAAGWRPPLPTDGDGHQGDPVRRAQRAEEKLAEVIGWCKEGDAVAIKCVSVIDRIRAVLADHARLGSSVRCAHIERIRAILDTIPSSPLPDVDALRTEIAAVLAEEPTCEHGTATATYCWPCAQRDRGAELGAYAEPLEPLTPDTGATSARRRTWPASSPLPADETEQQRWFVIAGPGIPTELGERPLEADWDGRVYPSLDDEHLGESLIECRRTYDDWGVYELVRVDDRPEWVPAVQSDEEKRDA